MYILQAHWFFQTITHLTGCTGTLEAVRVILLHIFKWGLMKSNEGKTQHVWDHVQ